MLNNIII